MRGSSWDIFCRVVDNFGDIGVCWRLAVDLAARGERVRLWVDDASALQWMAPHGATGVELRPWPASDASPTPGEVVIEAFGCEPPAGFVRSMAQAQRTPVWINLEYLSAEGVVERAHGLASPQTAGVGAGLRKWFFYPGFTPRTGGLIREADLTLRQQAFEPQAWLASQGTSPRDGERIVSLFCYAQPALPELIDQLATQPTLLLATAGHAAQQVEILFGRSLQRGALRALPLAPLSQPDYDHLLWASDLNFVRGEDSFVRAQWAARPFVWQIYPQHDGVHLDKLGAFLDRFLGDSLAPFAAATELRSFWQAWNDSNVALPRLPELAPWRRHCEAWSGALQAQADLATQLISFVTETR